jgi:predicted AAA+ superfamily ATPase
MVNNFINHYEPINIVMTISKNKAFKDKRLLITLDEINYLKNTLLIIKVFVKATNKL